MSFNYNNSTFISFADFSEVESRDQRLFEVNEDLTEVEIEKLLSEASMRILTQLRNTDWWKEYVFGRDASLQRDMRRLPSIDPTLINGREQEFKDLNIYFALAEYVYPRVADFGNETDSGVVKMKYFSDQYSKLFKEVVESGDWYDFDGDDTIETAEKSPVKLNLVRVR